ncbi:MAG: histidine kinase [Synergistaceae bacterium]|nr:histidine kinase [Synergistaceae bacterium]
METENTVCDFSDMMRYLSDNSHNRFVSLEEELKYLSCFAAIQRRRLDGHFNCAVSVPTKYYSVPCPFMLLHAVLENVFNSLMLMSLLMSLNITRTSKTRSK